MATDGDRKKDTDARRHSSDTERDRERIGTSYGATEREQTEDLRRRSPQADANVADGGVSEELERDSDSPAD